MGPEVLSPRDSRRRAPPTGIDPVTLRRFKAWMLPLCAAALLLAAWMLFHSLAGGQLAGCGAGSACDSVMHSPWAYVLGGVPVSLPAALVYVLLIVCVLFLGGDSAEARSLDHLIWKLLPVLAGCLAGAALWFSGLQLFVLHSFCKYCTLLHVLGCVVAAIILMAVHDRGTLLFAAGLAAAAVFAFVQARTLPDAVYDSGRSEADLPAFADGEVPVLGDLPVKPANDGQTLTLLFDFQCTHCRRLHRILPELLDRSGGQYRIRLCPVPLSSACNPYLPASGIDRFAGSCPLTRYALAVWYARPDAYAAYWDYLLGEGDPQAVIPPAEAEKRARALLGADFDAALADPRIEDALRKAEELFGRTSAGGKGGVPRLIAGQHWLVPETDSADELLELIRTEL